MGSASPNENNRTDRKPLPIGVYVVEAKNDMDLGG